MNSSSSAEGRFEPLHDAHAIEHVLIGIQFDRPLTDSTITQLQAACSTLADELPGKSEMRGFGFSISPQGFNPILQNQSNVPDGFVRTRTAPTGFVEKELRVDRGGILFRNSAYTRWIDVWSEAKRYISTTLSAVDDQVQLANYSLHYSDKFVWNGHQAACRPSSLLRSNSRFIAPHVFMAEDLWHSHTGIFTKTDQTIKRLLAVNTDCVDEPIDGEARRVVRITTVLTDLLNQPGFGQTMVTPEHRMDLIDSRINQLHNALKAVFCEIVTADVCKRIGLSS